MNKLTPYQKRMIRSVKALNLLKKHASEEDWDLLATTLEVLALRVVRGKFK